MKPGSKAVSKTVLRKTRNKLKAEKRILSANRHRNKIQCLFFLTIEIVRKWTQSHSPNIYCPKVLTNGCSDDIISTARYGVATYCQNPAPRTFIKMQKH